MIEPFFSPSLWIMLGLTILVVCLRLNVWQKIQKVYKAVFSNMPQLDLTHNHE